MDPTDPEVPQSIRIRAEWAGRLIRYITQHNDGPQVFCFAVLMFAIDALLVQTQRPPGGGGGAYVFLRTISGFREFQNISDSNETGVLLCLREFRKTFSCTIRS